MISTILILLIGWPGIITSLAISAAGIIRKNPIWLIAGAMLAVPFSWYLSQTPLFKHIGLLLPLFQLGAAVAVHKHVTWLAWLLLIPFTSIIGSIIGGFGLVVLFIALIYFARSLIRYLISGILKDKTKANVLFALIILSILLNIIWIITNKSNLDYTLFVLFTSLPGIIASLVFSIVGIIKKDPAWLITGAILASPFAWSISGSPLFNGLWIFLPLFQLGAAIAVYKRSAWLAWLLLIPSVSITGWLGLVTFL